MNGRRTQGHETIGWAEPVAGEVLVCSASQQPPRLCSHAELAPGPGVVPQPPPRPPPPAASRRLQTIDPLKVSKLRAFVKMCMQDPSVLHTEEMCFLREWVESMGGKISPATHKTKLEENTKEEKTVRTRRKT